MHFSTLLFSLSALVATSMANPAPALLTEALSVVDTVTGELGRHALSGSLPKNLAKIWIFSNRECDQNDGPAWNIYVLPGEERCIPYQNVGSIFAWYESDIGYVFRLCSKVDGLTCGLVIVGIARLRSIVAVTAEAAVRRRSTSNALVSCLRPSASLALGCKSIGRVTLHFASASRVVPFWEDAVEVVAAMRSGFLSSVFPCLHHKITH